MSGVKRHWAEGGGPDEDDGDEDDEDDEEGGTPGASSKGKNPRKRNSTSTGRRKIEISFIDNKAKRHVSFTKRKAGLMKKAYELSTLTGTECLIVVVSETGLVYTYATPNLKPIVDLERGREFIGLALKGELKDDNANDVPKPLDLEVGGLGGGGSAPRDEAMDSGAAEETANSFFSLDNLYPTTSQPHDSHQITDPFSSIQTGYPYTESPPLFQNLPTGLASFAAQSHLTHSPAPMEQETPFEDAETAHKLAYEAYAARSKEAEEAHSAHQMSEVRPGWSVPLGERLREGGSETPENAEAGSSTGFERKSRATLEERRNRARSEAAIALMTAKEVCWISTLLRRRGFLIVSRLQYPTIQNFIRAHSQQIIAQQAIPPTAQGDDMPRPVSAGIETTLSLFDAMSFQHGLSDPSSLKWATQQFLEGYLPSKDYSQKRLHEARQHLALFFDFAEGHSLISPDVHMDLTSFSFAPSINSNILSPTSASTFRSTDDPTESRGKHISAKLKSCVNGRGAEEGAEGERVDGVFSIYRIRSNFCLLSPSEDAIDPSLSPFKVRMPRDLTPFFKVDDVVRLSLRKSSGSSWIPYRFSDFIPSPLADAEESDIDPSSYEAEVARLTALPPSAENDANIRLSREVMDMLTRGRRLLDEGDLPENEG
ncbi:hypothetical protein P7C70_g3943, partial [Phenoliferia sp. Uapishka_3]